MERNPLGEAAARLLQTGEEQTLSSEECRVFHEDLREQVAPAIEKHREEQRRAYDQLREVILR